MLQQQQHQKEEWQRSLSLQCWDACLHYELARSEVWSQLKNSDIFEMDCIGGDTLLSIEDKTCIIALRHISLDYIGTSEANINKLLQDFKREKKDLFIVISDDRISMHMFISLLDSLKLVTNAVSVLNTLWEKLLQMDELLLQCIINANSTRTAVELEEEKLREKLLSCLRQWEHAHKLQEQLHKRVHLTTLHTIETTGKMRSIDDAIAIDRRKISRIREALNPDGIIQQQLIQQTSHIQRVSHLFQQLDILHEELRLAQSYETLALEQIRREEFRDFMQLCEDETNKLQRESQISRMEQQLGITGRFVIGLSVSILGRKGHDAILQQMRDNTTKGISITNTNIHTTNSNNNNNNNHLRSDNFTWLVKCDTDDNSSYCASPSITASQHFSLLQQQCVLDPSCYKALDTIKVSTHNLSDISSVPLTVEEKEEDEEDRIVEKALNSTFNSLVRLNYMELSNVFESISKEQEQEEQDQEDSSHPVKVSIPNNVVLFPSFLIFITCCELHLIGSPALAFARHSSQRINPNFAEKIKYQYQYQGFEWIADQAMSYNDFCAFLIDQASLEYVRDAFLFTPNALLKRIVVNIVMPKWLKEVKSHNIRYAHNSSEERKDLGGINSLNYTTMKPQCSNDLCVLLDTAVSWLQINSCTVRDFALAYRKHVVEYKYATRADLGRFNYTTTAVLLLVLFPLSLSSSLLSLLGITEERKNKIESVHINCDKSRLEALRGSFSDAFLEASKLVNNDGSLDGITGWLSVGITSISREELRQRVSTAITDILNFNFEGVFYNNGNDNNLLPDGSCGISHSTPVSWILLLAVCVKLSYDDSTFVCKLDKLFRVLIVS